ncbi:hypothetical protein H9X86_07395 [Pseudoflavonifractor capillosus]|uniref:hypothetical protein n=1 Tax=Pseudoflavonifractor capillosus TaxID=106588 RepID=UPI00195A4FBE|nr:hypothetical protein [Pseudoflavonifractor capillosus]MBM6897194.1 hypothetical protein [Pseudoflavonifractor capillosus]
MTNRLLGIKFVKLFSIKGCDPVLGKIFALWGGVVENNKNTLSIFLPSVGTHYLLIVIISVYYTQCDWRTKREGMT